MVDVAPWEASNGKHCLQILESANDLLSAAAMNRDESTFFPGMKNGDMNFISAIWYCEHIIWNDSRDQKDRSQRKAWLAGR